MVVDGMTYLDGLSLLDYGLALIVVGGDEDLGTREVGYLVLGGGTVCC